MRSLFAGVAGATVLAASLAVAAAWQIPTAHGSTCPHRQRAASPVAGNGPVTARSPAIHLTSWLAAPPCDPPLLTPPGARRTAAASGPDVPQLTAPTAP